MGASGPTGAISTSASIVFMKIFLIPCPIAENTSTEVLPPQILTTLQQTTHFLVENVRTARRFISELKLRYETGLTGNQGTGSGIYAPLNTGATPWGTGLLPASFTNPKLQWEQTMTHNVGLNLGLLSNRITIEGDYYVKNTDNLIPLRNLTIDVRAQ